MCLIVIAWRARGDLPLVVAANRDEWRERPTEPAHWWRGRGTSRQEGIPVMFAGRDLRAGGTWMGITDGGRFAAVTNYRDPSDKRSTARSRGTLVTEYLAHDQSPHEFVGRLALRASEYNGFNLILGDADCLVFFGSREGNVREIPPGVHGLSNRLLNEPWPKVVRGREAMQKSVRDPDPVPALFEMLSDSRGASDDELPDTGVGLEWERRLAAPLITGADYGTRASTVLTLSSAREVYFEERSRAPDGGVAGIARERFKLRGAS
jgi:uncharacterized protein with NRDE domain